MPFLVVAGADTACPDASVALRFSEITLERLMLSELLSLFYSTAEKTVY